VRQSRLTRISSAGDGVYVAGFQHLVARSNEERAQDTAQVLLVFDVGARRQQNYCFFASGNDRISASVKCTLIPAACSIFSALMVTTLVPNPRNRPISTWID